ncbi:hypothetical protein LLG90_28195, partial [Aromatoleum toluclasticum]|nr:hypothetical protein [Aromatoleum toluclasticum]
PGRLRPARRIHDLCRAPHQEHSLPRPGTQRGGRVSADRIVGFNKMPGLDVYYAADPCFEDKARRLRKPLYRYSPRYRHFSAYERAVFAPEVH